MHQKHYLPHGRERRHLFRGRQARAHESQRAQGVTFYKEHVRDVLTAFDAGGVPRLHRVE